MAFLPPTPKPSKMPPNLSSPALLPPLLRVLERRGCSHRVAIASGTPREARWRASCEPGSLSRARARKGAKSQFEIEKKKC